MLHRNLLVFLVGLCILPTYLEAYTFWGFANCHKQCEVVMDHCEKAFEKFIDHKTHLYTAKQKVSSQIYQTCNVTITSDTSRDGCQVHERHLRKGTVTNSTSMIMAGGFNDLLICAGQISSDEQKCGFVKLLPDQNPPKGSEECDTWKVSTSQAGK